MAGTGKIVGGAILLVIGILITGGGMTFSNIQSNKGISPEAEILPQRLQQIIGLEREMGIGIIYSEELVDPRLANVIAQEIPNGRVLVLSPIGVFCLIIG